VRGVRGRGDARKRSKDERKSRGTFERGTDHSDGNARGIRVAEFQGYDRWDPRLIEPHTDLLKLTLGLGCLALNSRSFPGSGEYKNLHINNWRDGRVWRTRQYPEIKVTWAHVRGGPTTEPLALLTAKS
jgi:hypothetical protein